jgi:hypothetical protein
MQGNNHARQGGSKTVTIELDARTWRGLTFDAFMLKNTFGRRVTAEDLAREAVERSRPSATTE